MILCRVALLVLMAAALAIPPPGLAADIERPQEAGILVFYDRTREAHLLFPYKLRILVLEDVAGSGGRCWTILSNGTTVLDREKCRPLANLRLGVTYRELMEYREAVTDENGVAEVEYRIFTFPKSSFVVRTISTEPIEGTITLETRPWALLSIVSFSSMLSAMVYTLRRGWW